MLESIIYTVCGYRRNNTVEQLSSCVVVTPDELYKMLSQLKVYDLPTCHDAFVFLECVDYTLEESLNLLLFDGRKKPDVLYLAESYYRHYVLPSVASFISDEIKIKLEIVNHKPSGMYYYGGRIREFDESDIDYFSIPTFSQFLRENPDVLQDYEESEIDEFTDIAEDYEVEELVVPLNYEFLINYINYIN